MPKSTGSGTMAALSDDGSEDNQCRFDQLSKMLSVGSLEEMEQHVKVACKIINHINLALISCGAATDAQRWVQALLEVKKHNKPTPVIIGVVGSTGAGKSSVINAILDEERIVPTNCFRACTAVITELAWNDSEIPEERYRGEIEFIRPEDWATELRQLQGDLVDSKGQTTTDAPEDDTDAGKAWAKIKAVYPKLSQKSFTDMNMDELSYDPRVREVLGTTKLVSASSAKPFYSQLQQYVDSTRGKPGRRKFVAKDEVENGLSPEYWPLVKMVRVYTKADALRTGARIIDLPGMQDVNAARAAVAAKFIQNCSALWIVAPISRAVSDKTAQHLLGQTFKLQAKYDNSFSKITFIASKSDDIIVSEALEVLEFKFLSEKEANALNEYLDASEKNKECKKELDKLKSSVKDLNKRAERLQSEKAEWQKLEQKLAKGTAVFAPGHLRREWKKRLRTESYRSVVGARQPSVESVRNCDHNDGSNSPMKEERKQLTHEQIQAKLNTFQVSLDETHGSIEAKKLEVIRIEKEHRDLSDKLSKIQPFATELCVRQRNNSSEKGIKAHFVEGIREIDAEDDTEFDPESSETHDKIGKSLPVFCVSSMAYQTLRNRFHGEVLGFNTLQDTQIPQLQSHAVLMTKSARSVTARRFLGVFCQQMESLSLWAASQILQSKLDAAQREAEVAHLHAILETLRQDLIEKADQTIVEIEAELSNRLTNRFAAGCAKAEDEAAITASDWGASPVDGGMFWATYKATCRRDGEFSGSRGYRNLNEELIEPLKTRLANSWERMFTNIIPKVLAKSTEDCRDIMQQFHSNYMERMESNLDATDAIIMHSQIRVRSRSFKYAMSDIAIKVNELQRAANRLFTPAIVRRLTQAYSDCVNERGRGSFRRMKDLMVDRVAEQKDHMFQDACNSVDEALVLMCDEIKHDLHTKINETVNAMSVDYLQALMEREASSASKAVRSKVQRLLAKVHSSFENGHDDLFFDEVAPIEQDKDMTPNDEEYERVHIKEEDEWAPIEEEDERTLIKEEYESIWID